MTDAPLTYQQLFVLVLAAGAVVIIGVAWVVIIRDAVRDLRRWHQGDWPYWLRRLRRRRWQPRPLRYRVNLLSPAPSLRYREPSWWRRVLVRIRVRV